MTSRPSASPAGRDLEERSLLARINAALFVTAMRHKPAASGSCCRTRPAPAASRRAVSRQGDTVNRPRNRCTALARRTADRHLLPEDGPLSSEEGRTGNERSRTEIRRRVSLRRLYAVWQLPLSISKRRNGRPACVPPGAPAHFTRDPRAFLDEAGSRTVAKKDLARPWGRGYIPVHRGGAGVGEPSVHGAALRSFDKLE